VPKTLPLRGDVDAGLPVCRTAPWPKVGRRPRQWDLQSAISLQGPLQRCNPDVEVLERNRAVFELVGNRPIANDRSGDQLRKINNDIERERNERALRLRNTKYEMTWKVKKEMPSGIGIGGFGSFHS